MRNFFGNDSEYLESRVLSATPAGLIEILYEKALEHLTKAQVQLHSGEILERGLSISRTQAIINELVNCIDRKQGGEIAQNLLRLYDYSNIRLTEAHRLGSETILKEVAGILQNMLDGWREANRLTESSRIGEPFTADHVMVQPEASPALRSWTA